MIDIIGAGGIGSYLIPCLVKTEKDICIWDGDSFEEKNLSRQIFNSSDLERNKADALAEMYGVKSEPKYFKISDSLKGSLAFVCVDNDATRMDLLDYADEENICLIIGGNETYASSAMMYMPEWKDTPLDPRVIYPNYADRAGRDPRKPPCNTLESIQENPQLPLANMMAAAMMLKIYEYYSITYPTLADEYKYCAPHTFYASKAGVRTVTIGGRSGAEG